MANYNRLSNGISYGEAVRILGGPGTEIARTDIGDISTLMFTWTASGLAGLTGGNMNAMFQNDRLVSKAQMGLK